MEAVIFIGIQATGKSTYFKRRFFDTHIRINQDMLKTKNRERLLLEACLQGKQSFVVDKQNLSRSERIQYISKARELNFSVTGYYFQSKASDSIDRNLQRTGKARIPEIAIRGSFSKLEIPDLSEGFDKLYYVKIEQGEFLVHEWSETEYG